jgi:hypothetical protein
LETTADQPGQVLSMTREMAAGVWVVGSVIAHRHGKKSAIPRLRFSVTSRQVWVINGPVILEVRTSA